MRIFLFIFAILTCVYSLPPKFDGTERLILTDFMQQLVQAAKKRIGVTKLYDPTYVKLDYPGGDVANDRGVCTDVVIRAYRKLGIDLQILVHKDMQKNFNKYPKHWGLKNTDKNIDHRRVPNLQKFFENQGRVLKVTDNAADYQPGDLVTWNLRGKTNDLGVPHIGIVSDQLSLDDKRPLIIHNIGAGTCQEDILFDYLITGHYQFSGAYVYPEHPLYPPYPTLRTKLSTKVKLSIKK